MLILHNKDGEILQGHPWWGRSGVEKPLEVRGEDSVGEGEEGRAQSGSQQEIRAGETLGPPQPSPFAG